MTTDNLCHRLRTLLGGELGNEAADRIEQQAKDIAALTDGGVTAQQVARWLEDNRLCAVSKADAERVERCKATCEAEQLPMVPGWNEMRLVGAERHPDDIERDAINEACQQRAMSLDKQGNKQ